MKETVKSTYSMPQNILVATHGGPCLVPCFSSNAWTWKSIAALTMAMKYFSWSQCDKCPDRRKNIASEEESNQNYLYYVSHVCWYSFPYKGGTGGIQLAGCNRGLAGPDNCENFVDEPETWKWKTLFRVWSIALDFWRVLTGHRGWWEGGVEAYRCKTGCHNFL